MIKTRLSNQDDPTAYLIGKLVAVKHLDSKHVGVVYEAATYHDHGAGKIVFRVSILMDKAKKTFILEDLKDLKVLTKDSISTQKEHERRYLGEWVMPKMKLKVKLDPGAKMPTRAHEHDGGLDLYAAQSARIWPHDRKAIDTGTHVAIPPGYVGLLTSKSGLMRNNGLTCRGTIDAGYTGSIQAVMFNHTDGYIEIEKGQKVTQLVIMPILTPELELVDELEETDRGAGGFGSTGR